MAVVAGGGDLLPSGFLAKMQDAAAWDHKDKDAPKNSFLALLLNFHDAESQKALGEKTVG